MDRKDENDFWESSNDDFWNKSIMPDDWIKEDTGSTQNPYMQNTEAAAQDNPYTNDSWYEDSWYEKSYDTSQQVYAQITGEKPKKNTQRNTQRNATGIEIGAEKKRVHVCTIICLCFIFIAIGSVAASIISVFKIREDAANKVSEVSFTEEEVGDSFQFNENNEIFLEDVAYTIMTEESFADFPKGQKMIAVSVEVFSDEYISGNEVLEDIYIGYTKDGMNFYKTDVSRNTINSYVMTVGFQDGQILHSYGIGNGIDESGFFFFFVPDDVEEITFYAEQREEEGSILMLKKVYKKEMSVVPESQEVIEELTGREAY